MTDDTRLADPSAPSGAGDERPESLLPPSLTTSWQRLRLAWRPADTGAVVLAAAHLSMLSWVALPGGFYLDDFRLQSMAAEAPLGADHLFRTPGSHLAPIPRLLIWVQTDLAPLERWSAVGAMLVLQGVLAGLVWLLFRELFGPRRATLVPFTLFCFSPFIVPMFGWWTQAVTLNPAHVAMVATLLLHVRYLRTGRRRTAVAAVVTYGVGLLCWEKALLALPVAVLLTVLFLAPGDTWRARLRASWRWYRLALAYVLVTAAYLAVYLSGGYDRGAPGLRVGVGDALEAYGTNLTRSLLPGLVGGPWSWDADNSPYFGISDPGPALISVAAALVVVVTVLAVRRDPSRVARAWLVLLVPWVLGFGMVIVGRVSKFGILAAADYRYVAEFAFLGPLALGLATLPLAGRVSPAGSHRWHEHHRHQHSALRRAAPVLVVAYLVGAAASVSAWGSAWHDNPNADTVPALRESFLAAPTPVHVYDVPVPAEMLPPLFDPYQRLPRLLAPLDDGRMEVGNGSVSGRVLDEEGRLVPATLSTITVGRPGPASDCGRPLNESSPTVLVPLERRVPALDGLVLRLGLLVGADSSIEVVAESPTGSAVLTPPEGMSIRSGPNAVVLALAAEPVTRIRVTLLDTTIGSCLDTVTVARPVPAGDA